MNENYQIEPMRVADFEAVIALWKATEGVGLNESDSPEGLTAYLAHNPGMSFVARCDDKIVGAVLCGSDGRRGYLQHLAVAREHRRHGIAAGLIESCFQELKKLGIQKSCIFVYANNEAGKAFWRHNGWNAREDLQMMQKVVLQ